MPPRNWFVTIVRIQAGVLALCVCVGGIAAAEEQSPPANPPPAVKVEVVATGNSSAASRKKAVADIPIDKIAADLRPKVAEVL